MPQCFECVVIGSVCVAAGEGIGSCDRELTAASLG